MPIKMNFVSPTNTDDDNAIGQHLDAMLSPERAEDIRHRVAHPEELTTIKSSAGARKASEVKEEQAISRAHLPRISKEIIVDRSLLDPAPDTWNFFGQPDEESYDILMNSIIVEGLLNPVTLWERPNGRYMILAGHTRNHVYADLYEATGDVKWMQIPAKIYGKDDISENDARRIIIVSNIAQRAKESPRVRYHCYAEYAKLVKDAASYGSGIDVNQTVADTFGVHRTTVFFYRRLHNLIEPLLDMFCKDEITSKEAKVFCAMPANLQQYLVDNDIVHEFNPNQLKRLRKAKTVDDVDHILLTDNTRSVYRGSFCSAIEKPKGTKAFGLYVPEKDLDKVREAIQTALSNVDVSEDTKQLLLKQI